MKTLVTGLIVVVGILAVLDWREDWRMARQLGLVPEKGPPQAQGPYFEPMGISYRQVMKGLEKTFRMQEQSGLRQPRFIARDEATQALLEIRGERENVGFARLAVPMPRVTLDPEPGQTGQAIGLALLRTFLRNTVPEASGSWLDARIAAHYRGERISTENVDFGRKITIRVAMGYIIQLIVTKA